MPTDVYTNALTTVQWPNWDHIPALRCPVTGMVISLDFGHDQDPQKDIPLLPADEQCPTLMFRYNYEAGMEYVHPDFAKAIEGKMQELVESGDAEDIEEIDELEVISDHLESLGEAPMVIDMPTVGLPGDGIVVGLDLARAIGAASD